MEILLAALLWADFSITLRRVSAHPTRLVYVAELDRYRFERNGVPRYLCRQIDRDARLFYLNDCIPDMISRQGFERR